MIILNQEQERIAYSKGTGLIGVKGIAGSGKTSCGIARIPFLLQNYCSSPKDRILVITYNKTLVNYVKHIYEEYSNQKYSLFSLENEKVEICSVDKLMFEYYRRYCKRKENEVSEIIEESQANEILKEITGLYYKNYPNIHQIQPGNFDFIKREISWMQNCNFVSEAEYQIADRQGLVTQDTDGPQKLAKNSEVRQVIYKILNDYLKEVKRINRITFEARRICALKEARTEAKKKYKHIIVDEAQDLSKTQLEFIKEIYLDTDASSLMFLYDGAQSIYDQAWIGKKRSFKSVGFDLSGKVRTLTKNFRTTTQISKAAYSLFKNYESILDDEHFIEPKLLERHGEFPIFKKFESFMEQCNYVKSLLEGELSSINRKDIVVIARTTEILRELAMVFNSIGVPAYILDKNISEFSEDKIKLITMHSIKGLESKVIIMASCNEGVIPYYTSKEQDAMREQEIMDSKLFYVGMTRATDRLFLLSHGKESKFINMIDKNLLIHDEKMKMRALYNVSIDNYLFKNNSRMDIYKGEEKVRQWLLKELIDTYKYPLASIDIEFMVKMGSYTGFADIVVYSTQGEQRVPYILIEIKKAGSLVESDINQLRSYCSVTPTVKYSILTDGKTIKIYDKEFQELKDIPIFSSEEEVPTSVYNYIAFKEGYDCKLSMFEMERKLEIFEGNETRTFLNEDLSVIPIIGKISAGYGSEMIEDPMGELSLPKKWATNSMLLKVKGESMIDADIEDGDLALIKREITPLNGDIVACTLSDTDCTLKRFMKKSDQIILIPENKDYERIYLNPNDENIRIIGVMSGLIKK